MNKDRIKYIDIAKGIGICLVIAGHTVTTGSALINLIFAFHMPLFVILTGMTIRKTESLSSYCKNTLKDAKYLALPFLICNIVYFILLLTTQGKGVSESIRTVLNDMVFKNDGGVNNYAIWFLIALFLAKAIYRFVDLYFNNSIIIYLLLAYAGMRIGTLPLCIDIALVMSLFIYVGAQISVYEKWDSAHKSTISKVVLAVCFVCFILLKEKGTTMYMYERAYINSLWCIIAGICGSIIVIEVAKALENIDLVSLILSKIGSVTIYILAVHFIDGFIYPFTKTSNFVEMIIRIIVDVAVGLGLSMVVRIMANYSILHAKN